MFRNPIMQRSIAALLVASFTSLSLTPLTAAANPAITSAAPNVSMVGTEVLIPLQPRDMSQDTADVAVKSRGLPEGKGWDVAAVLKAAASGKAGTQLNGAANYQVAGAAVGNAAVQGYSRALGQLQELAKKAGGASGATQVAAIRGQYTQVQKQEVIMAQVFAATEQHIRSQGLPAEILQRHQATVAEYDTRNAALTKAMASLDKAAAAKAGTQAAVAELDQLLRRHSSQTGQNAAEKGKLPWGERKNKPNKAALLPRQFERLFPRSVQVASAGSLSGIALPDTVLSDAVQPADLGATDDVQLTADIRALAASLNDNPVTIYNWVRNNIQFAPGYGAMQGATGTLFAKRGNAFDTASLLIALYRSAGIPARYVYGTIEVPVSRLNNWLSVDNAAAAQSLLTQAGIPHQSTLHAGQVSAVQLEHVWVEAMVDYSPSRGAINKAAQIWVPMDASFKQMQNKAGLGLRSAISLNEAALFDAAKQGATCTTDYGQNISVASLQSGYGDYKSKVANLLTQQGSDVTVGDVLGSRSIGAENYSILLGSLPYKIVSQGAVINIFPDHLRWQFRLQLYADTAAQGTNQPTVSLAASLPSLAGKRISLSFSPATAADAMTLASYMPKAHGDGSAIQHGEFPSSIPGYLIRVSAELRVDGQLVSRGGSFTLGSELAADIGLADPAAGGFNTVTFYPHAGDYQAVAIDAQGVGADHLNAVKARLNATQAKLVANQTGDLTRDDVSGDILYQAALAYFATADANGGIFQRASGVVDQRLPSYGRAIAQAMPQMVMGIVGNVSFPGVVLDIDRMSSAVAATGSGLDAASYLRQSNERNAAYAHLVLAKLFNNAQLAGDAASPVKALFTAIAQGQPVYAVTSANRTVLLPQLNLSATALADVDNLAAAGYRVLVSPNPVTVGAWSGQGLIGEDSVTGAGSYRITGSAGYATAALYPQAGMGWLAQAEPFQAAAAVSPVAQAAQTINGILAAMLGSSSDTTRWSFFPGQDEVVNGLFLARLAAAKGTQPCDSLSSIVAASLGTSAGFENGSVPGAPVITSAPVTGAAAAQAYTYAVAATDPQGLALSYRLTDAPTGMTIGANGVVTWAKPVAGTYKVTVQADNGKAYAQQAYQLTVSEQAAALNGTVTVTPAVANLGDLVTISFATTGGTGVIAKSLTIDGQSVPISVDGQAVVTATAMGAHQIVVTAEDKIGTITRAATYSVRNPADSTVPVALITSPIDDSQIKAPAVIVGTASAASLAYYQLLLRPAGSTAWKEVARGTTSVSNGVLGKLDPTTLANGIYELLLNVVDANGNQKTQLVTLDVYGDLKIGQFAISFQDLNVDAAGIPVRVTRTYDTRRKSENLDFGYGWSVDYQSVQLRKNMHLGLQWLVTSKQFLLCLAPVGKRKINITLPDGSVQRFSAANAEECAFGTIPPVDVKLNPLPGTTAKLEIVNVPSLLTQGGMLYDADNFQAWNPKEFKLTSEDNYIYYITEGIGITKVVAPGGSTLTYGQNGVVHSSGQSVAFTRDASKRITAITDPAGKKITYAYNTSGDLVSVTDRAGAVSKYAYNSTHGLTSYTDPSGTVSARYEYDAEGRLVAAYDATGRAVELTHDTANNKEVVKDRMGNITTYTYDASGNVVEKVDALNNKTTYGYDANGNESSVTDAYGKTTTRGFDQQSGKQLTEKDPLGNTVTWAYDSATKTQLQSTTDARGNVTRFDYFMNGSQTITEPLGRITALSMNGDNLAQLGIAGQVTRYAYDAKGNKTGETDASGNVTTFAYDANNREISRSWTTTVAGVNKTVTVTRTLDAEGRVTAETDALGFVTRTEYNAGGQVTATIDPQNRATRYEYDSRGKLARTVYPDGGSEAMAYDANGNQTSSTDRQGRTTRYEYDALNRLVKTLYPDGSTSGTRYDAVGRVEATIDAGLKETVNTYDDAGRLWKITSPDQKVTTFGYDANGNRTSVTDANNQTTGYRYDELNRLVETRLPNGKTAAVVWNVNGTKKSETDFSGNLTEYGYDPMGRLNQVRQTNGATAQVTVYGFDNLGNKTSQTDAEGRITRWEYDVASRVTSRTLPGGQKESFQYDAVGNLTAKVDFAGKTTSYVYNAAYQPSQSARPDGAAIATTYTASGQVASVTVTGGVGMQTGTTLYSYDAQDRLIKQTNPDGSFIAYGYDANGNITQRSTSAGTVTYGYDASQRLQSVTDAQGKTTGYTYEATGKLETASLPNGVTAYYKYDVNGRLVQVLHRKGSQIVTGVKYTLADNGQRTRVEEYDGLSTQDANGPGNPALTRDYQYDGVGRLQEEKVTDRSSAVMRTTGYTYDRVGNRKTKAETTSAGTESIAYSYDSNDRLTQENKTTGAGGQVVTAYTWDANGNLKTKTTGTSTSFFYWNADNRLIEVKQGASEATAQTVAKYAYDANGNRVQKQEGDKVTNYLTDSTFTYAQVLQEVTTQAGSSSTTNYVWGNGLIQQVRGGQGTFYHADALGSVKTLTDVAGAQTDTYVYEAFGAVESKTGTTVNSYRYTGEYFDEQVGLQYNRDRWLDLNIGRFVSMDPEVGRTARPTSLHKYVYADNDPISKTDPSGRMTIQEQTQALEIQGQQASMVFANFGRQAGGKFLRQLGEMTENAVKKLIEQCLKPGAQISKNTTKLPVPGGGNAVPDFFVTMGNKTKIIEVKYSLGGAASESFKRAADQMKASLQKSESMLVVFKDFAASKQGKMKKIVDDLDGAKGPLQIANGFGQMGGYLAEFLIEGCLH